MLATTSIIQFMNKTKGVEGGDHVFKKHKTNVK
jgi:hypothetical protein